MLGRGSAALFAPLPEATATASRGGRGPPLTHHLEHALRHFIPRWNAGIPLDVAPDVVIVGRRHDKVVALLLVPARRRSDGREPKMRVAMPALIDALAEEDADAARASRSRPADRGGAEGPECGGLLRVAREPAIARPRRHNEIRYRRCDQTRTL